VEPGPAQRQHDHPYRHTDDRHLQRRSSPFEPGLLGPLPGRLRVSRDADGGRREAGRQAARGHSPVESISITTPEPFRAHVLSAEFFDAKAHPELKFASTALDVQEDGHAHVSGDLTIKGVTKRVHAIGVWTAPAADAFGNNRANLALEAVIDRTEWGINWNAPLPSGGNALGHEVMLSISLSLVEEA
jgi:polyisoprenoid-binding protein YceI